MYIYIYIYIYAYIYIYIYACCVCICLLAYVCAYLRKRDSTVSASTRNSVADET